MATGTTVSIKLVVDTKNNKVLFAEAGKDFVDFLFNLLALPVGTVISLLKKENVVGCLGNLYGSVESLSSDYMQPKFDRNSLLQPKTINSSSTLLPLLLHNDQMPRQKIFQCRGSSSWGCRTFTTYDSMMRCPGCGDTASYLPGWAEMIHESVVLASESSAGYVMGLVKYMVTDNLVVKPMTVSSITTEINVKEVELNMAECLKLLKESLMSEMVLTNVFLRKSSA